MSKESVSIMYYQKKPHKQIDKKRQRVENWSTCYSFTLNDEFNMQSDIKSGQSNAFRCVESKTGLRSEREKKKKHDSDCVSWQRTNRTDEQLFGISMVIKPDSTERL